MNIRSKYNGDIYAPFMPKQTQVQNKVTNTIAIFAQASRAEEADSFEKFEEMMSLEDFEELINSDMSLEEKHAMIREAFGDIITQDALEISIKGVKDGKSSIEHMKTEFERRTAMNKTSLSEMYMAFEKSAPGNDEVERSKAISARFIEIRGKLEAGIPLNGGEKSFLREHFPKMLADAERVEEEVARLKRDLKACKSKEEAAQLMMERKLSAANEAKDNNIAMFLIPAFDEVYRNHLSGRG